MREYGVGKIATVSGRYYAMDRDKKWDREKKAFDAMVFGDAEGGRCIDAGQGVKDSYNRGVTDEFIIPFVLTDNRGEPLGNIRDGDVCINSTSAPTAPGRSRAAWRATATSLPRMAVNWKALKTWTARFRATAFPKISPTSA